MIDFNRDMELLKQVKEFELLFNELNDFYSKVKSEIDLLKNNPHFSLEEKKFNEKEIFIKQLNNNHYVLLGKTSSKLSATLRALNLDIPCNQKLSFNFNVNTFSKNINIFKKIIEDRFSEEFDKTSLYKKIKENVHDSNEEYNNNLIVVLEENQILKKYALGDSFRQNLNYFLVTILQQANSHIAYKFIEQYSLSENFLKQISKTKLSILKDTKFLEVMNKTILNKKLSSELTTKKTKIKNNKI